ncbi:MAG: lamin tail domain-containing protein [Candidatus Altiarchaeota archaeon]|nr:lamin tail domain-containing protein [Candidatus Altiarchaeota archaeon]
MTKIGNNKGWIVWSISRIGVMMAVMVIVLILFSMYQYVTCINCSDSANLAAEGLTRTLASVYAGPVGTQAAYALPSKISGRPYQADMVDGEKKGVIISVFETRCGTSKGGSPLNARLASYPEPLKNSTEENVLVTIKNLEDGLHINKMNGCLKCITLEEFNFDAPGDDCQNLNGEYIRFTNNCTIDCMLAGWSVTDLIEPRPGYVFNEFSLAQGASATLYTGCGTDTQAEVYWCSGGYPCNAVWNNDGDTLYLKDPAGELSIEYSYIEET